MRQSQLFLKTNKSAKEFDSINATLLQKAGFIDQVMAGVYAFLPLGLRVLNKIENIVREEMDTIGNELLMTGLSPKELWEQSHRLDTVDVLFKACGANDASLHKNNAEYVLNCTHEDIITPLVKKYFSSYRDFPFALYQIQVKYRNEARPKSGLLRGREFRMKDLYSFHVSEEDLMKFYEKKARPAYVRIFERLGIGNDTHISLASGGDFTEGYSHEFQTRCETGEDVIFYSKKTNTYYNREIAPSRAPSFNQNDETPKPMEEIIGEGVIGTEALVDYLNIPIEKTTKTLIYQADNGRFAAAAVRGDYDVNEEKLKKVLHANTLSLASAEMVYRITDAEVGYAGLCNLPESVEVVMDDSMKGRINFECGANKTNYHAVNVNFGRDLPIPKQFYDIKLAKKGDLDPETGEPFEVFNASEVGNIFPLNTKFSKNFGYYYTDEQGTQQLVYMGSYGIGTTRVMGVIVEKYNDNKGILWPKSVTPYQVHLLNLISHNSQESDTLYETLQKKGFEVLYDDRDIRAGEKFSDADLIGICVRLVISEKTGGKVEWKERNLDSTELLSVDETIKKLKDYYADVPS